MRATRGALLDASRPAGPFDLAVVPDARGALGFPRVETVYIVTLQDGGLILSRRRRGEHRR